MQFRGSNYARQRAATQAKASNGEGGEARKPFAPTNPETRGPPTTSGTARGRKGPRRCPVARDTPPRAWGLGGGEGGEGGGGELRELRECGFWPKVCSGQARGLFWFAQCFAGCRLFQRFWAVLGGCCCGGGRDGSPAAAAAAGAARALAGASPGPFGRGGELGPGKAPGRRRPLFAAAGNRTATKRMACKGPRTRRPPSPHPTPRTRPQNAPPIQPLISPLACT